MLVELPTASADTVAGWGRPAKTNRAHYFVDSVSLCGKWQLFGGFLNPGYPRSHDCAECRRQWQRDHAHERAAKRIH